MKINIATIRTLAPISLLLILAALILSIQIGKPFYGYHDWNGVTYGQIARNYVRYSPIGTLFGQVENLPVVKSGEFRFDTHFPPLFTLLLSIPVAIFGTAEWAIRLPAVLLSLLSLYLIFLLGKAMLSWSAGLVSAVLALLTPIFIYFGKNPMHEVLILPFLLAETLLFYLILNASQKRQRQRYFRWLAIICLLSLFSGWPAYYPVFAIGLLGLLKTRSKLFILFLVIPFLTLTLHFLHVRLLTGSFTGGGLGQIIGYRLSLTTAGTKDAFTPLGFFGRFLLYSRNMFGIPLLLASLVGFLSVPKLRLYFLVLATGILHPLIFSNAGYLHDYLQLPMLGFVALTATAALSRLGKEKVLALAVLLALINLWTKWPFTKAMIYSEMSKPEYDLVMNKIAPLPNGESIVLPANEAVLLRGVVAPYYLQAEVEFRDGSLPDYAVIREPGRLLVVPNY